MNKEEILSKIKKLRALMVNSNDNEATNAKVLADRLISKYNITEEELESIKDKKPLYGENEKLFHSSVIIGWKNQLALGLANYFNCYIVQEELVPVDGQSEFDYYVYGDDDDINSVKFSFNCLEKKIDNLVLSRCYNKGPVYVSSYCEGLVQSIRSNIELDGIYIPKINQQPLEKQNKIIDNKNSITAVSKCNKEKPMKESININNQNNIKDIMAYFNGLQDGKNISLQDTMELEFKHL